MPDTSDVSSPRPIAAQYVVTFLKPEMQHIYRQITALQAFRPVVFCQKRENADLFPYPNLILQPKPRSHQLRRFWQKQLLGLPIQIYRSEAHRLLAELHRVGAQVLHIYFGHIGVFLLPLLEICDLPVIVSFHGADAQVDQDKPAHLAATRRLLEKCTLLLVRSESLAERLVLMGCERSKIRLHRTGIPLEQIPVLRRSAPPDGVWRCVQACRLIAKKGLRTSLRAFAQFARTFPAATFTIAGQGPQLDDLRSLARNLGIGHQVFFTGFLSPIQLHALYTESHLFLHPSELATDGDQEGVPNSMLEAMAGGMPVVATTHGGIPEAVESGISGLLTPEGDWEALCQSMLCLAQDPPRYAAMSLAAQTRVSAQFELGAQTRQLERAYQEAISNHRRLR